MSTLYRRQTEAQRINRVAWLVRISVTVATIACWLGSAFLVWQLVRMAMGWS